MVRFLNLNKISKPRPPWGDAPRIWNAMRQRRRFTMEELAAITELPVARVYQATLEWRRAGIVAVDNDGFRLARDLGPQPPFRYGKVSGLVDRKTGEVFPLSLLGRPKRRKKVAL